MSWLSEYVEDETERINEAQLSDFTNPVDIAQTSMGLQWEDLLNPTSALTGGVSLLPGEPTETGSSTSSTSGNTEEEEEDETDWSSLLSGIQDTLGTLDVGGLTGESLAQQRSLTDVGLSDTELQSIDYANSVLSGETGNFLSMLEGDYDWGQWVAGVEQPAISQALKEDIPAVGEAFSQQGFGGGYWTGARQDAQAEVLTTLNETLAESMAKQYDKIQEDSLTALSMLPALTELSSVARENEVANIERAISTYYQEAGLEIQEYTADLQTMGLALEMSQFDWQQFVDEWGMTFQEDQIDDAQNDTLGMVADILRGITG